MSFFSPPPHSICESRIQFRLALEVSRRVSIFNLSTTPNTVAPYWYRFSIKKTLSVIMFIDAATTIKPMEE